MYAIASVNKADLVPESISAAMVGLTSKLVTFSVQREFNNSVQEPLTAILPGVALTQLWQMSRGIESALRLMTQLILLASLLGLAAMMIATLRERSYELSVFRALGAGSSKVFLLIQIETLLVSIVGIVFGAMIFLLSVLLLSPRLAVAYGVDLGTGQFSTYHILVVVYVLAGALIIGIVPAIAGFFKSKNI